MWIEMRKNKVKKIIKAGKSAVGTFLLSRSIANLEILAMAGFDFVVIDTEHFMKNPETIEHLIITAEATGIVPFVRIQENVNLIERVLSAGARGIVVPMCNTMEVAQAAVDNGKYVPAGKRGVCNTRAVTYGATGFEDMVSFFRTENENIMIIAQIETLEAVNNLPDIMAVNGIDACFVGPLDLSHSLGITCEFDNPILEGHIQQILKQGKKAKMPMGILSFNAEAVNRRLAQGFSFVAMSCDTLFLAQAAAGEMKKVIRR